MSKDDYSLEVQIATEELATYIKDLNNLHKTLSGFSTQDADLVTLRKASEIKAPAGVAATTVKKVHTALVKRVKEVLKEVG